MEHYKTSNGALLGGAAIVGGSALASGAGGTTITTCPSTDTSAYCKSVRYFQMFKMLLFIIIIIVILIFIFLMFKKK